jgi:SAM-dependent methyltransferase
MKEIKSIHFEEKYFKEIDRISEEKNYFTPVLNDLLKRIDARNSKILDVGCGTGIFLKPLVLAGCSDLYGVDGSHGFMERALKRGYKNISVVSDLNINCLPFDCKQFDLVVCKDVFEHLLNPKHVLAEICRVVKDDGLVLFHVPNHFPLEGRLKFLVRNDIDTFKYFSGESRWTFPHIRFYEYRDLIKTLNEYGLCLIENLSFHFIAIPWISRIKALQPLFRHIVLRYPSQFNSAFTLILKKS